MRRVGGGGGGGGRSIGGCSLMVMMVMVIVSSVAAFSRPLWTHGNDKTQVDMMGIGDDVMDDSTINRIDDSEVNNTGTTTTEITGSTTQEIDSTTQEIDSTTQEIDSTTDKSSSPAQTSTPTPPTDPSDEKLFQDTLEELNGIDDTLEQFLQLVEEDTKGSEGRRSSAGGQDHPAAWWNVEDEHRSLRDLDICATDDAKLCKEIEQSFEKTNELVSVLNDNVEDWNEEQLTRLRIENKELSQHCSDAKQDEDFKTTIKLEPFTSAITDVKEGVEKGISRIEDILGDTSNPNSVVLVAVMGSVGGLMIVGLVGVMIYGAVKKGKTKKKRSKTPYNKLQGENIPIGGFLSDAPQSNLSYPRTSPSARTSDPYAAPPARTSDPYAAPPARTSDPYAAPPAPTRSDANYRPPVITRMGQRLPRTHL